MPDAIFLDTGPLGLLVHRKESAEVAAIRQWLTDCIAAGRLVYLPEISDYEIRREMLLQGFHKSITYLDTLKLELNYLPITTAAILKAAELWSQVRRTGIPTADRHSLDGDVILAAQALTYTEQSTAIVVTTNPKHIARYVNCSQWNMVIP